MLQLYEIVVWFPNSSARTRTVYELGNQTNEIVIYNVLVNI